MTCSIPSEKKGKGNPEDGCCVRSYTPGFHFTSPVAIDRLFL